MVAMVAGVAQPWPHMDAGHPDAPPTSWARPRGLEENLLRPEIRGSQAVLEARLDERWLLVFHQGTPTG